MRFSRSVTRTSAIGLRRRTGSVLVAGLTAIGAMHLAVPDAVLGVEPNPVLTISGGAPTIDGHWASTGASAISGDGRHLVYGSDAADLVAADTNGLTDVFVTDLSAASVVRASLTDAGQEIAHAPADPTWVKGKQSTWGPAISDDGRFVAFRHTSPDLVAGDSNGVADVFVRDLLSGHTERVSVSSSGEQGNDHSGYDGATLWVARRGLTISGDGRFVAFYSTATNLVPGAQASWLPCSEDPGDPGGPPHPPADAGAPSASFTREPSTPVVGEVVSFTDTSTDSDGTIVAWSWDFGDGTSSSEQNPTHAFAEAGVATVTLSVTDNDGKQGAIFWRFRVGPLGAPVASFSYAPSVPYATTPVSFTDYSFDYDGTVVGWSWDFGDGTQSTEQNPSHAFASSNTYTVSLTVTDNDGLADEWTREVMVQAEPPTLIPRCPGQLYVHDRTTGQTELIGDVNGAPLPCCAYDVAISDDGRYVAFFLGDANPTGVYVKDRLTGDLQLLVALQDDRYAFFEVIAYDWLSMSGNGRYVVFNAFETLIPELEPPTPGFDTNGQDTYVVDRVSGELEIVSVTAGSGLGAGGEPARIGPGISDDGQYVAFWSPGADIVLPRLPDCQTVEYDTGQTEVLCGNHVYVRDRATSTNYLLSQTPDGVGADAPAGQASISDDGCAAAYHSSATNLIADPPPGGAYVARLKWPHCVGGVRLTKLVNGGVDLSQSWSFSLDGPGVSTSAATDSASNVLTFGDGLLAADEPYTLCEQGIPPGWRAVWTLDGSDASAEAYNPDAPEDLGNRCLELTIAAAHTVEVVVDNRPPPGGEARTIGYWKNWSSCDEHGNQADVLDQTLAAGSLAIGQLEVSACQQAVALLAKSSIDSGKGRASDAAYGLAAQLLAAKLNVVAGAGGCSDATSAISDGQALLFGLDFDGTGGYLPPKTRDRATRAHALKLAVVLDAYNNNTLC